MREPGYASAYAELADAEAFYALYRHSKKSNPPKFYEARDRLAEARRTFDFSTVVKQIEWTEASRLSSERRAAEEAEQASPAGMARFAEEIVKAEGRYRHSLDSDTCLSGLSGHDGMPGLAFSGVGAKPLPLEGDARQIFTHRHSIYCAMVSVLVHRGPAGLREAWAEWGQRAIEGERDGREHRKLLVDSSSDFIQLPQARGSTRHGKNGYWEHDETHMVPLPVPSEPVPLSRMQAYRERQRLASGTPKRGRGRPVKVNTPPS